MDTEMKKYLVIIGFEEDIEEIPKLKTVLKMWRKSARICHPDKGGEKSKFQELQDALENIIEMIKQLKKNKLEDDDTDEEELFAMKLFNEFNCKKENSNSYNLNRKGKIGTMEFYFV